MNSSNNRKGARFMAFVEHVGPFPTSALATADPTRTSRVRPSSVATSPAAPSPDVAQAARLLVGGLPLASAERVQRVAMRLARLVELERQASSTDKKRGRARESA